MSRGIDIFEYRCNDCPLIWAEQAGKYTAFNINEIKHKHKKETGHSHGEFLLNGKRIS